MSIFKTLGNKLKRVVSLKNVIAAATGNFTAVLADAKRIATSPDPKKKTKASQVVMKLPDTTMLEQAVANQDAVYQENLTSSLASSKLVQDNINGANAFMSKLWWKATWQKNKTIIIFVGLVIVGLISWLIFRKKPQSRRGRR